MEEIELDETPKDDDKEIEIIKGSNKYNCKIQINKEYLHVYIYNNNILKYKGNIHIINIQYHLGVYDYDINDIFDEIYKLNNNKFNLIKEINKYKLKIEFIILNKKRYINIDLYEDSINNNNNEYIRIIKELKSIIKEKDNKIKLLEEELNKYKNANYIDNSYDDFNIKDKEPKHILEYNKEKINSSTVLKDGRFVIGSSNNSIIIYNNKTFQPDLIIKEHKGGVNSVIQLISGELASCSYDKTINIYNINENEYKVIQTLKEHTNWVSKIIELKNKQLVSCSGDKSIIFYNKKDKEYEMDYSIYIDGSNGPIIQTKDNEICYYEYDNTICFYDFINKNNIKKINNISVTYCTFDSLLMVSKDLLFIAGKNKISIVNINSYNLIKTIDAFDSSWIYSLCMLNKDMILTADANKRITQWKIENNNLKHDDWIYTLSKLGNGLILSGSADCSIKIW